MQLASCRLVSGGEGMGEREMEMDGEVGSAVGDLLLVDALVGDPVGGEDGGPVGGCMLGVGDEDVGCPVVDPAGGCGVVVVASMVASVVCSRL